MACAAVVGETAIFRQQQWQSSHAAADAKPFAEPVEVYSSANLSAKRPIGSSSSKSISLPT
jgi:hypothetical protein